MYSKDSFQLEVVSHLPEFSKRSLKQYDLNGMLTVGAFGNEPFEIRFKNNTYEKVQVKLSLDGTDVQTGKLANSSTSNEGMWVVGANSTMSLKAWPESNKGGSRFVFTSEENGVATHTHGIMSSKGIIAAAVFTDAHRPLPYYRNHRGFYLDNLYYGSSTGGWGGTLGSPSYRSSSSVTKGVASNAGGTYNISDISEESFGAASASAAPAVGAGEYVEQNITTATGLVQPTLNQIIRVRYMWWDELKENLRKQASRQRADALLGFPGDAEEKPMVNLGTTPKIKTGASEPQFTFERLI